MIHILKAWASPQNDGMKLQAAFNIRSTHIAIATEQNRTKIFMNFWTAIDKYFFPSTELPKEVKRSDTSKNILFYFWNQRYINHLRTKHNLFYLNTEFVPRSKHTPSQL